MRSATSGRREGARRHRLFGLTLLSEFDFRSRLSPGRGEADLIFSVVRDAPVEAALGEPVYESPLLDDAGDSLSRLYRLPSHELLRFGDALDFYLGADRIDCHQRLAEGSHLVEIRLLGPVLAYWLERMGICALHASAVVVDGGAVAFMATHQGGKTGLAAAMAAAGAPLLTDDLLPVEECGGSLLARSGYPQMRMWPDQLPAFVEDWEGLDAVHPDLAKRRVPVGPEGFGSFHDAAVPPRAIYGPQRSPGRETGGGIRFEPLSAREALIELVRNSFTPFIVEAVGLQAKRLELLGRLAREVPVRRLRYPSCTDMLVRVGEAVQEDLASR